MLAAMIGTPCAAQQSDEIEQNIFQQMQEHDKAVVVAIHFGSSEPSARATIDKFNAKLKAAYPNCDFREAWTSRMIIKKLGKDGVTHIYNPDELLTELEKQGYTHVLMQSSNIINGQEMQSLRFLVDSMRDHFKQIRIGEHLLSSTDDYEKAMNATMNAYGKEKEANVLVCHGSEGMINGQYTMLDYMLNASGHPNWYVSTIEGYPTFDNLVDKLKKQKLKTVNLIPFLFVAGDHAKNDIATEWPERLKAFGYKASATLHSIGEIDAILDIYMAHAKHAEQFYKYSAKEMKMRRALR